MSEYFDKNLDASARLHPSEIYVVLNTTDPTKRQQILDALYDADYKELTEASMKAKSLSLTTLKNYLITAIPDLQ